jgi:outer membrane protein TolC
LLSAALSVCLALSRAGPDLFLECCAGAEPVTTRNDSAAAPGQLLPSVVPPAPPFPIDLPSALKLAESVNPVIGEARARVLEALGHETRARAILLPSLNAGGNYHDHTGGLQRSTGQILRVDAQSLYFGGGAGALAQNSVAIPAVLVSAPLVEAIFEPLAARQVVTATGFEASATANQILLWVANNFLELQGAIARLRARSLTVAEAAAVVRITAAYARTGEGRQADADRAATEWKLRRADVHQAEGQVAVVSAKLVRLLHLDPTVRIDPAGDPMQTYTLIDPETPLESLIQTAIGQRPEVQARTADIGRAEYRLQQEGLRPFLPTVWLGFSGGAFGGGSNLDPPTMGRFRGRTDFDVYAFWTLQNFGMGNLTLQKRRRAEVGEASATRARAINRVRDEVASAHADVLARREQIAIALGEVATAREGFVKDLQRIEQAAGFPLEVLDNLRYLARAREALIDAVIGYNQAQFGLFVAMGSPPPLEGPTAPAPPGVVLAETPTLSSVPGGAPVFPRAPGAFAPKPATLPADPVREALESLARARQDAITAMNDYERVQKRLMESLDDGKTAVDRNALRAQLKNLAEAHRSGANAQLQYERALWEVAAKTGNAPPATNPSPMRPAETTRPATTSSTRTAPVAASPSLDPVRR